MKPQASPELVEQLNRAIARELQVSIQYIWQQRLRPRGPRPSGARSKPTRSQGGKQVAESQDTRCPPQRPRQHGGRRPRSLYRVRLRRQDPRRVARRRRPSVRARRSDRLGAGRQRGVLHRYGGSARSHSRCRGPKDGLRPRSLSSSRAAHRKRPDPAGVCCGRGMRWPWRSRFGCHGESMQRAQGLEGRGHWSDVREWKDAAKFGTATPEPQTNA